MDDTYFSAWDDKSFSISILYTRNQKLDLDIYVPFPSKEYIFTEIEY